jgi:hypothetical protein
MQYHEDSLYLYSDFEFFMLQQVFSPLVWDHNMGAGGQTYAIFLALQKFRFYVFLDSNKLFLTLFTNKKYNVTQFLKCAIVCGFFAGV